MHQILLYWMTDWSQESETRSSVTVTHCKLSKKKKKKKKKQKQTKKPQRIDMGPFVLAGFFSKNPPSSFI